MCRRRAAASIRSSSSGSTNKVICVWAPRCQRTGLAGATEACVASGAPSMNVSANRDAARLVMVVRNCRPFLPLHRHCLTRRRNAVTASTIAANSIGGDPGGCRRKQRHPVGPKKCLQVVLRRSFHVLYCLHRSRRKTICMVRVGLIPGLHSEKHKAAWQAARRLYFAAGGPPKCTSMAKHGGPCRGAALRGHTQCRYHVASAVRREQRLARLSRLRTPEQVKRAVRREASRVQRVIWRSNRWEQGATVLLGERDVEFRTYARAAGFDPDRFSPATVDAARWAWIHVQVGRMTPDQFQARLAWHVSRD